MCTNKKNEETFKIIPSDEKKCVWMENGIVTYKICDRDFQCESCPLEKGLRGHHNVHDDKSGNKNESI